MKSIFQILSGNGHPDSDNNGGRDKDAKKLSAKPSLHDPLPTDHAIGSYQVIIFS